MSDTPAPPSPHIYFETINAFQRAGALKAAIKFGLFTVIGATSSTAAEIAEAYNELTEAGFRDDALHTPPSSAKSAVIATK
jgi:hypothetical protein